MYREKSNLTTGILLRNPWILAYLRSHGNGEGEAGMWTRARAVPAQEIEAESHAGATHK